ncbi:hypothetical protein [Xanthomarina sp. F2636L]|uniref:hypothetical protein n=1 Tax=Xanthomarina sp. F2636L TaxID=2996018 RepID=UPI00225E4299|nr:hypothetical protein [Xanthomarina sp. F2636L]MCX7552238.1 hypothetical protein [Xanthomarina sp. F2636L]
MKYKNIPSAIHNFGHSYISYENYVDSGFVIEDLNKINQKNYDIKIDWKTKEFSPKNMITNRISLSIGFWYDKIYKHFSSQNVEYDSLKSFYLIWNNGEKPKVVATDDRGKLHEKNIAPLF